MVICAAPFFQVRLKRTLIDIRFACVAFASRGNDGTRSISATTEGRKRRDTSAPRHNFRRADCLRLPRVAVEGRAPADSVSQARLR